ncbi:hypothetical protein ACPV4W_17045 [Vibrio diabolicus]|uniref:Cap15 family cyclic dinucleotide receptor domain-containing protein n=1 Tax=Vibrio diabolicus TaxID=50719 RepID=UPI00106E00EE|nr:hypothetical protein [Vibrio diabolicus]
MWDIINPKIRLWITIGASIAVFVFYSSFLDQEVIRAISSTVTTLAFLAWVIGKYAWRYIYIDILKKKLCPDFNGRWMGKISSNYAGGTEVSFPIEIEADFFKIRMKANTTVGRTYADYCRVVRTKDDKFELSYIFEGHNKTQTDTDTSYYDGAAKVIVDDIKTMKMSGLFWTNRCWNKGENTAGRIEFEKIPD